MFADLRTQTEAIWFECHSWCVLADVSILITTTSEEGCQNGCNLTVRVDQGKLRQSTFKKKCLQQDRRNSQTKNTTQLSRASTVQFCSQKILQLPVSTRIVKTCLKNLPRLSVQTPVLLMY